MHSLSTYLQVAAILLFLGVVIAWDIRAKRRAREIELRWAKQIWRVVVATWRSARASDRPGPRDGPGPSSRLPRPR